MTPLAAKSRQRREDARQPPHKREKGGRAREANSIGENRITEARRSLDEEIQAEVLRVTEAIKNLEKQKSRLNELMR